MSRADKQDDGSEQSDPDASRYAEDSNGSEDREVEKLLSADMGSALHESVVNAPGGGHGDSGLGRSGLSGSASSSSDHGTSSYARYRQITYVESSHQENIQSGNVPGASGGFGSYPDFGDSSDVITDDEDDQENLVIAE